MTAEHNWRKVKIKDIGRVVTGRTPPTVIDSYFGSEYPFITPSDMSGDKFIIRPERWLSSEGATLLINNCLSSKSIAVSCIGWQMGKVIMISSPSFTNQQINTIIPNNTVDPDFIYYSMCTRRYELKALASVGTRTPILIKSTFENIDILLPPLPTQRKIAAILSAYDDLIENNTRCIAILEEMAQSVYREWFVHFRFPGHEKISMVESALGMIPEGWEVRKLGDALTLQRGFDLPTSQRLLGEVPVYAATGINGMHDTAKVKGPGVLTGRSGSLGTVIYVLEDFWPLNTTLWVKDFQLVTPIYAFYLLSSIDLATFNSGAAVPTLNRNDVHKVSVIIPPKSIIEEFDNVISPMFVLKESSTKKNANLRQTRDLLLPKLIAGEIDVEGMEVAMGENGPDRSTYDQMPTGQTPTRGVSTY
jgi:type I restriction enzyme S subunit